MLELRDIKTSSVGLDELRDKANAAIAAIHSAGAGSLDRVQQVWVHTDQRLIDLLSRMTGLVALGEPSVPPSHRAHFGRVVRMAKIWGLRAARPLFTEMFRRQEAFNATVLETLNQVIARVEKQRTEFEPDAEFGRMVRELTKRVADLESRRAPGAQR